jgi:peptidoglycan/LPS O-acetylase OafA/YrhL
MAFSNIAYWSLNYEVWYYVFFSIVFFFTGRQRLLLILAVGLILGPKILLLAPIWWMGVYLHRSELLRRISEPVGWLLFVGSLILLWQFHELELETNLTLWLKSQIGAELHRELTFSRYFLSDYILAPIILMNFAGFRAIAHRFGRVALLAEKPIRFFAGYTFSLYLFHQPLILFFAALFDGDPAGYAFYTQVMIGVFVTVFVLGRFTEKKKYVFRGLVERIFDAVSQMAVWSRFRTSPDLLERGVNETRD